MPFIAVVVSVRAEQIDDADAVVAVHDAANIDAAHTVAVSKGGLITVDLVSRFPERVVSATSIVAMSPDPCGGDRSRVLNRARWRDPAEMILALMGSFDGDDRAWLSRELDRAGSGRPADRTRANDPWPRP